MHYNNNITERSCAITAADGVFCGMVIQADNTYIFHSAGGSPLGKASLERMYIHLMIAAGLAIPKERKRTKRAKKKPDQLDSAWDICSK